LSFFQGRRAKEDENGFNASHCSTFDANNVKKIDIDSIVAVDVIGCGANEPRDAQDNGKFGSPTAHAKEDSLSLPNE
jgi:hypothetical protein